MNKAIIGIDIGGTKMRGVLWNGRKIIKSREILTPDNLVDFKSTFAKLVKSLGGTKHQIAIGAAGIIRGNVVAESPNIPYLKNFDFFNVLLDNDARCFGRAEYKASSAAGAKTVFFVTLGTGVGRALGKNGRILKIKKFEYPEPWEREYQKCRDSRNNKRLAGYLAKKLVKLIKPYGPQLMVVGGGVSRRKSFIAEFKKKSKITFKTSKFGQNAAAIGAATLLIKEVRLPKGRGK